MGDYAAQRAIDAPVDKEAESTVAEFLNLGRIVLLLSIAPGRRLIRLQTGRVWNGSTLRAAQSAYENESTQDRTSHRCPPHGSTWKKHGLEPASSDWAAVILVSGPELFKPGGGRLIQISSDPGVSD